MKYNSSKHNLYNANYDTTLLSERAKCKEICFKYNNLSPNCQEEKNSLIKTLFKKTGDSFLIEPSFWCDYGYKIEIGNNFYSNHNLVILDFGGVSFGDNVFIGPNCGFYTSGHPIDKSLRNEGLEYALPIKIGDNVWIGAGVSVLPGVTIGDNCVIGAGSVVNKDIPANCIAVGNPCRVIKDIDHE